MEKGPRHAPHVNTTRRASRRLEAVFGRAFVRVQDPIVLSPTSEPEPDIVVTRHPETRFTDENPTAGDVLLVVEVSDTTLAFDRSTRANLTEPTGDGYGSVATRAEMETALAGATPVPVAELL